MGDAKGTGLVYLRHQLKDKGSDALQAFLDQLTAEEKKRFNIITHISMIPIDLVVKFCVEGSKILYPTLTEEEALFKLNFHMAHDQMNGVYKVLLKFANPDYVIKQTAKLWNTIHNKGEATSNKGQDGLSVDFSVTNYPELPEKFLIMMEGYVAGVLDLAGTKNLKIARDYSNKNKWLMHLTWKK